MHPADAAVHLFVYFGTALGTGRRQRHAASAGQHPGPFEVTAGITPHQCSDMFAEHCSTTPAETILFGDGHAADRAEVAVKAFEMVTARCAKCVFRVQ